MVDSTCYHCGDECGSRSIQFDDKDFCCNGCKTVYEIFTSNGLSTFYEIEGKAGTTPNDIRQKYDFLDNQEIVERLVEFDEEGVQVVSLSIPTIHCSSCIWVLENLNKLHSAIKVSQVDFPKKTIRVTFKTEDFSLKALVLLLGSIGYEPYISLEEYNKKEKRVDRSLIYKLGVAGFAFGNVMLFSFPEYFEVEEFWLDQYKHVFRWLMFAFSLPVVFYASKDYFVSAYKGIRSKLLNIDVPIALGILVLFLRSTVDIIFDLGSGFFDSLTGLVFFLLLGKFFQQKTYAYLSFERDYKSYFPIAVTRLKKNGEEENIQIYNIEVGDRVLIRSHEIIPVDCILIKGSAEIDYSFVTGESEAVFKESGEKLFAGGKQLSGVLEVEVLKSVSQSYLTQLWGNSVFSKDKASQFQTLTDSIGKRFTIAVLSIATVATFFWLIVDASLAMNVFTSVLIIACPCAIALAAPFTLGNMLRIFGKYKFYLKNTNVIERLAKIDTAIFDKTGTLTTNIKDTIHYEGMELTEEETALLKTTLRASNHPLSRSLYDILKSNAIMTLEEFQEHTGKGIEGKYNHHSIKVGSASYVGESKTNTLTNTSVYVSADEDVKGRFVFKNTYRDGMSQIFDELSTDLELGILSGDNDGEKAQLQKVLPEKTKMLFDQKPEDKLEYIKTLQEKHKVLMVGDGLNDAGALAQGDVGLAVSENINVFSPACDGILDASKLRMLPRFIKLSRKSMRIIKMSFLLSLCYNVVGLYFAVTGQLQPVIAAILMPLSSISIVVFTTVATNYLGKELKNQES
ncbi:heavy metal translocating P-type ATPase metal-binding domain-containing protein [Muricauda oceani]|uniref:Heavy metal translocating P-type ATPase n=1 Tax=Flagellimonas oceani TaxID=2698672 RepID=A0A6G7J8F8_9FLAO|nr:heavy metal translocating P-type ATPase metal-binding domain-containing protein [Allomuricauda oceani]MBW8242010.1 heavy metal translocating P-type ATPase metal-binding domain-containing protein [Allomuricauda oceani]QII46919.1 heavy metal translocating P-type ATPase [Allomuricauda oceani]